MQYPDFDPSSPNTPLSDAELQALDEVLQTLPTEESMTLDGMDGYLCALLVGPPGLAALRSADWLPAIWGGDPQPDSAAPFASNQKKKRTTVLVLRHLQSIACQLRDAPALWEPVLSVAELPGTAGAELADATEWCLGFLQATDLAPDAWQPLFADPALATGLGAIARLGGDEGLAAIAFAATPPADGDGGDDADIGLAGGDLDDPAVRDALSRRAADVVPALHARRSAAR